MAQSYDESWRLAMVVPFQGPAGMFGPSCEAVTELALAELNATSGVGGRPVSVEFVDGGASPETVGAKISELVRNERIDAVTGWHISSVRLAIAHETAAKLPYVYTSLYEGGEDRAGVVCLGETPSTQIAPALEWLRDQVGLRRWLIVGDDYVWPRKSSAEIRARSQDLGVTVVGEHFVPYGVGRIRHLVDLAERTHCDGVLMLLVGQHAVDFNREFSKRGLSARIARYSPLMEETMLLASGAGATENLYVSASYFRSLQTTEAMDLVSAYTKLHGPSAPPLNNMAESCYEGIKFLADAAARTRSTKAERILPNTAEASYAGPRGTVNFTGGKALQPIHLAMAAGLDFDILTTL
ncbi:MAG: substrate-binding domain-containing protein [Pseudarthrobacter sp.]